MGLGTVAVMGHVRSDEGSPLIVALHAATAKVARITTMDRRTAYPAFSGLSGARLVQAGSGAAFPFVARAEQARC